MEGDYQPRHGITLATVITPVTLSETVTSVTLHRE